MGFNGIFNHQEVFLYIYYIVRLWQPPISSKKGPKKRLLSFGIPNQHLRPQLPFHSTPRRTSPCPAFADKDMLVDSLAACFIHDKSQKVITTVIQLAIPLWYLVSISGVAHLSPRKHLVCPGVLNPPPTLTSSLFLWTILSIVHFPLIWRCPLSSCNSLIEDVGYITGCGSLKDMDFEIDPNRG